MLVNKQLGYKNNSNLANNVEIDEGYRQKKNYSFKSLFSLSDLLDLDTLYVSLHNTKNGKVLSLLTKKLTFYGWPGITI